MPALRNVMFDVINSDKDMHEYAEPPTNPRNLIVKEDYPSGVPTSSFKLNPPSPWEAVELVIGEEWMETAILLNETGIPEWMD